MLLYKQQRVVLLLYTKSFSFLAFKPVMIIRKLLRKRTTFKQRSNKPNS